MLVFLARQRPARSEQEARTIERQMRKEGAVGVRIIRPTKNYQAQRWVLEGLWADQPGRPPAGWARVWYEEADLEPFRLSRSRGRPA